LLNCAIVLPIQWQTARFANSSVAAYFVQTGPPPLLRTLAYQ